MEFYDKLLAVQSELKAPKDKYNSFGKYAYRSAEGILEAVKPLLRANGLLMVVQDDIVEIGGRVFCKAIVKITDADSKTPVEITTTAFAEIATEKKGMDVSQITGTASSYARKYALNGLFLIDDTKDADTDEYIATTRGEDVANKKITKVKAKSLEGRLNTCGVNVEKLLASYGVKSLEELTEAQHYDIINKLRKHEEKKQ